MLLRSIRVLTRLSWVLAIASLFSLNVTTAQTSDGIYRVAPSGSDVIGCGTVAKPCRTPDFAILESYDGGQYKGDIRIAEGTYSSSGVSQNTFSVFRVVAPATLTITGGYSSSNWSVSNPNANPTTIDGANSKLPILISMGVVEANSCNVSISGLTVQNGVAPSFAISGGGIQINNCKNVTLRDLIVKNNKSVAPAGTNDATGGGIAIGGNSSIQPTVSLTNVKILNNQVIGGDQAGSGVGGYGNGGGLFATQANVIASNLTVSGNQSRGGSSGGSKTRDSLGGGIALILCPSFTLDTIFVEQNSTQSGAGGYALGAGIFVELSSGSISNATIQQNTATGGGGSGSGAEGGGIHATDTTLSLSNISILNNSVTVASGNGEAYGGGLSTTTVGNAYNLTGENLIIGGNSATGGSYSAGGGISLNKTLFNLSHITLANNQAGSAGQAGTFLQAGATGSIKNSIVSGHAGQHTFYIPAGPTGISFQNILNNDTTVEFVGADNGTSAYSTQNIFKGDPKFVNAASSNFHIGIGSDAEDQAVGSSATQDIDKQLRPIGAAADVGADELEIDTIVKVGKTNIDLDWDAAPGSTGATTYQVVYNSSDGGTDPTEGPSPIDVGGTTTINLTGLTAKKHYTITIEAYNGATKVASSQTFEIFTDPTKIFLPLVTR